MVQRQSRERPLLVPSRMLEPGEIDADIDVAGLVRPPAVTWDAETVATCRSLYHRHVAPGTGGAVPEAAFCDLPKWIFLEFVATRADVVLFGCGHDALGHLPSVVLATNHRSWHRPRHYAFSDSVDALFAAVLDLAHLARLDCPSRTTISLVLRGDGLRGHYFGIDYRALPHGPWRVGFVYLFRRSDLPPDFGRVPSLSRRPIRPLARVRVRPRDFPLLERVTGVDLLAQHRRQLETYRGFPWANDGAIHPNLWQRPLVGRARTTLERNFAEPTSLGRLGRDAGVSAFAMLRMFRAQVGVSPKEYQTDLRVAEAKRLLRAGLSPARAAAAAGFCDQTHLARHFRRHVGMTPGQYVRAQERPIGAA